MTLAADTVEDKICSVYSDCVQLNAYCAYFKFDFTTYQIISKCKCGSGFDHITGKQAYTASDGNTYTSECEHVSG